jgi:prevent-host-death family protein
MCYDVHMRTIPQRTLRNRISEVLRQVEAGERLRITVDGRPVADLVPISGARRTFVPQGALRELLAGVSLDPAFAPDVNAAAGATIDDLRQ